MLLLGRWCYKQLLADARRLHKETVSNHCITHEHERLYAQYHYYCYLAAAYRPHDTFCNSRSTSASQRYNQLSFSISMAHRIVAPEAKSALLQRLANAQRNSIEIV